MINNELKQFMDKHIVAGRDTDKITVFPLPCGVGKSTYVTQMIGDALYFNKGLIVVTDSIERLKSYTNSKYPYADDALMDYIKKNIDHISILYSDNYKEEIKTMNFKPIVLMATQRYFAMTRDEIKSLTKYKYGTRDTIVIDEKPLLFQSIDVSYKQLNDITTAFETALHNEVKAEDKTNIINIWQKINNQLQDALKTNESLNNGYKREMFLNADALGIKTNETSIPKLLNIDEESLYKFFDLVNKYKFLLLKNNRTEYKNLIAIKKLMTEAIIISSKKRKNKDGSQYDNRYKVFINNFDKVIDVGAKVFVFDGTADISPDYKVRKYVNIVDCSQFKRDLSNLTINIIDVSTSKTKLTGKSNKNIDKYINAIVDGIFAKSPPTNVVFSYKDIEPILKDRFSNGNVNWFGNIKGTNQYREHNSICQIGVNRYSELEYVLYANEIGQLNDDSKTLINRIYDLETINDIRCRQIVADIEQNLYRGSIRNNDNQPYTYTLAFKINEDSKVFENYRPLYNMIVDRYGKYGATINEIEAPMEIQLLKIQERNAKKETNAQKIINWIRKKPIGYEFERKDILNDLDISEKQFEKIRSRSEAIKILLEKCRVKQGLYRR